MKWEKLNTRKQKYFSRGNTFRCPGKYPYEDYVDFMMIACPEAGGEHALIVSTGSKAGHVLIYLPREAMAPEEEKIVGISSKWLVENWNKWIYEMGPEGVYFSKNYEISEEWKRKMRSQSSFLKE